MSALALAVFPLHNFNIKSSFENNSKQEAMTPMRSLILIIFSIQNRY